MRSKIEAVKVVQQPDDDPDLSWLDQTDEEMGEGFEKAAQERKDAYQRGDWYMIGIYAQCDTLIVPEGWSFGVSQHIKSGGLWGIESDSGQDYLDEIANQELDDLAAILGTMMLDPAEVAVAIEEARP